MTGQMCSPGSGSLCVTADISQWLSQLVVLGALRRNLWGLDSARLREFPPVPQEFRVQPCKKCSNPDFVDLCQSTKAHLR